MTVYLAPLWDAPLDADAHVSAIPEGALIKGFFSSTILNEARRRGLSLGRDDEKYLPFLDYSLRDHNRLIVDAAKTFWPELSIRRALRKIGRAAIFSLRETTFGKAVLGGVMQPETVMRALASTGRTYTTTFSKPTPSFELTETGEQSAILRLRDAWGFPDSEQIGVIEGVCRACSTRVDVRVAVLGPADAEFLCTWEVAPGSRPSGV
jgi:uncharacterized protein (TIGR02265 family)